MVEEEAETPAVEELGEEDEEDEDADAEAEELED